MRRAVITKIVPEPIDIDDQFQAGLIQFAQPEISHFDLVPLRSGQNDPGAV
jgi:hypothetical protein